MKSEISKKPLDSPLPKKMAIKFKKQQLEDFSEFIDTFTQKLIYEIEEQNPDILTALLKIFDQIHIVKSLREHELKENDYYSTKSQLHYFDSTYQDIGNTLNGDANTQYDN